LKLNDQGFCFHSLRHSYATHSLDNGADLHALQIVLGHGHITQTAHYIRLSTNRFKAMPNPLDQLLQ
jgi:integrase/recombinase XerD